MGRFIFGLFFWGFIISIWLDDNFRARIGDLLIGFFGRVITLLVMLGVAVIALGGTIFLVVVLFIRWREKRQSASRPKPQTKRKTSQGTKNERLLREEIRRLKAEQARQNKAAKTAFTGSITTEKEALELFEMSKPFTLSELKKRRNGLLQKTHPDQGGSGMMVRFVNDAYDILKGNI